MPTLPAGDIEHAGTDGKGQDVDQPGDVAPVESFAEQRRVLGEVMGVEVRRPPLA